ncbi:MAG: hypothetical protein AAGH40_12810 [Verrucomicrobiota bacterium]
MFSFILISLAVIGGISLLVIVLSIFSPTKMEYDETIKIEAPLNDVFDDIRIQERLMRWSAWPKETKSQCAVDTKSALKKEDGSVGVQTVFFSKGKRFGHQEILSISEESEIVFALEGAGPPHYPTLTFRLEKLGDTTTSVTLNFINRMPPPFNLIWNFAGLSRWTRTMHVKDLQGLKAFSEPPHKDTDGRTVGRDPNLPNPYEVSLQTIA